MLFRCIAFLGILVILRVVDFRPDLRDAGRDRMALLLKFSDQVQCLRILRQRVTPERQTRMCIMQFKAADTGVIIVFQRHIGA